MFSTNSPQPHEIWAKGNCRDADDPDIFYPDRDADTYPRIAADAKRHCRDSDLGPRCPVILDCLLYGLLTEDRFGIWGGMSVRERNALRRSGSLERYRSVQDLNGHPTYVMIDNYLEQQHRGDGTDGEGR